ncbi:MAG: sulfur carrier protein [Aliidongia sp.]|jgi:sulfur carrier protein|nr:sulfur carrier protein [Aliidongia sp.]
MTEARIKVNGTILPWHDATISALLAEHGIDATTRGVAVARNGALVPRARWVETALAAGDEIEIIKAMSGG